MIPTRRNLARPAPVRRGLALIEVLLCASIGAMMLTATAVAFRSSIMVYRDNTDRNMLLSQGRIAMCQLIQDIRQSDVQQPVNDTANPNATTLFSQGQIVETTGLVLQKQHSDSDDPSVVYGTPATYPLITWVYDPANKRVTRTRWVSGTAAVSTVWATGVQSFLISQAPERSAAHYASGDPNYDSLYRAVVTMTLQNVDSSGKMINSQGTTTVTERIVDAAVPRRNFSDIR